MIKLELWPFFQLHFLQNTCMWVRNEDGPGRGHLCHTDTFLVSYIVYLHFSSNLWAHSILVISWGSWKHVLWLHIFLSFSTQYFSIKIIGKRHKYVITQCEISLLEISCTCKWTHHYENKPVIYTENFTTKKKPKVIRYKSDIFHISDQNIDCGYSLEPPRRGGSNAYPQSMFLSRNMKNNVYPCKPQFYYINVGFKGVNII